MGRQYQIDIESHDNRRNSDWSLFATIWSMSLHWSNVCGQPIGKYIFPYAKQFVQINYKLTWIFQTNKNNEKKRLWTDLLLAKFQQAGKSKKKRHQNKYFFLIDRYKDSSVDFGKYFLRLLFIFTWSIEWGNLFLQVNTKCFLFVIVCWWSCWW